MVRRRIFWVLSIFFAVGFIWLYYHFDPTHSHWALKCPFKYFTGWDCPACGGQRALHTALHGEFGQALRYNPFMIISIPYLLAVTYTTIFKTTFAKRCYSIVQHKYVVMTFFCLIIGWWILRNTLWWSHLGIQL